MTPKSFLASLCVTTALTTAAYAQDTATPDVQEIDAIYFVTWIEATVREAPSSTAPALAPIWMGDRINVTGIVEGTDWLRVGLEDGTVGYVWDGVLAPAMVGGGSGGGTAEAPPPPAGPPADGVGNSIYEASILGPLSPGEMVLTEYVGDSDLDDYYEFELTEWSLVDLALQDLQADADLVLTDEFEYVIGSSEASGNDSEYVQEAVPPGRYYVRVSAFEGNTDYTLILYTEPTDPPPPDTVGDSMDDATPIAAPGAEPQVLEERIDIGDREDWYTFTVEEVTEVTASLTGLEGDLDLELSGSAGHPISVGDASGNADETFTAVVGPGTYYLRVYLYSGQSPYRLEVSGRPSDAQPDPTGNPADSAIDLGALDPAAPEGLSASDSAGPGNTDDYFGFTLDEETAIQVRLVFRQGDLDLELLDEQGAIISLSNNSGSATETLVETLGPGTYYLHVYVFEGSADYTLSVAPATQP